MKYLNNQNKCPVTGITAKEIAQEICPSLTDFEKSVMYFKQNIQIVDHALQMSIDSLFMMEWEPISDTVADMPITTDYSNALATLSC